MTIAILATGDEIIQGDILNTNTYHIAQSLHSDNLPVGLQLACSDSQSEIQQCLKFLETNHEVIITVGGLGPTSDDRTRFALANHLNSPLIENLEALQHIKTRLGLNHLHLNAGNAQQALFPVGATLLPNIHGTAMGCYVLSNDKHFIMLPGPPKECLPMLKNYVLPILDKYVNNARPIFKWRLFGVAESQIAEELDESLRGFDCETGYRWETPYVEFKVRCESHLLESIKQKIDPIIQPLIITTPDKKASECLLEKINAMKEPISIVDEVTGGVLQTLIFHPSNFNHLYFSDNKNATFRFRLKGLEEYWNQEKTTKRSRLSIEYSHGKEIHKECSEIAYRSAYAIYYAAEWLSFRIFHLLNQLH